MFAILGRTYETNLTCCLWNALIVYPELAALSTPNIVFSAKYPIFAPRTAQIIFLTTCASEKYRGSAAIARRHQFANW